jgi:hypothetical protein
MRKQTQLGALFLTASLAAVAQNSSPKVFRSGNEWVEEINGTLAAGKIVKAKTSGGDIKVAGGAQSNVIYVIRKRVSAQSEETARRLFALLKTNAYNSGETVFLRAECGGSNGSADFEIHVPSQTSLIKLDTSGGAVTATNISGQVEANTGGGTIHMDQIGGIVVARSGGGDIEIGKTSSDVQLDTGGGNIHVVGAGGNVKASSGGGDVNIGYGNVMVLDTGGGSIKVTKCTGQVKASSGGGNLDLSDISGTAQLETGSGTIHIGPVHGGVRAETGAGNIVANLAGVKNSFSASRLETSMGDIVVYVPEDLGVTIHAAVDVARGKGILSDLSGLTITASGEGAGPREVYAEGSLNGGGPVLHVHTVSGNIQFKRKDKDQEKK